MISQFFGSILDGFGSLLMQWSRFYGALFGNIFGLLIVFAILLTGWHTTIYFFYFVTGHEMYALFEWDRTREAKNGVRITEPYVYYGGPDGDKIMASFTVTNTLSYPVTNVGLKCQVVAGYSDKVTEVDFVSGVIPANSTRRVAAKSNNGYHYLGIMSSAPADCVLHRAQQAGDFYKPRRK